MGSRIASLALQDSVFSIGGALETAGHQMIGQPFGPVVGQPGLDVQIRDDAQGAFGGGDVVIEFTTPPSTIEHVRLAQTLKRPMVIGTTGLSDAQCKEIEAASKVIAIVFSPNMSVGVNVLFELAQAAQERLGSSYDVEVNETHHRQKKDAPSGTAKRLAELLAAVRRQPAESIPVHAERLGDTVGDHTVVFTGPSERLELTHRAQSRDVFAQGALKAAQFVHGKRSGLYGMSDVLTAAKRK